MVVSCAAHLLRVAGIVRGIVHAETDHVTCSSSCEPDAAPVQRLDDGSAGRLHQSSTMTVSRRHGLRDVLLDLFDQIAWSFLASLILVTMASSTCGLSTFCSMVATRCARLP